MPGEAFGEPLGLPADRLWILPGLQTRPDERLERRADGEGTAADAIELRVAPIPEDQLIVLVEDGKRLGNDVQRVGQMGVGGSSARFRLLGCSLRLRKCRFGAVLLGDVLMGRDPAVAGHWAMPDAHDAAVCQFDRGVRILGDDGRTVTPDQIVFLGHPGGAAHGIAQIDDVVQLHARMDGVRIEVVDLQVLPVADDQALVLVEEAETIDLDRPLYR